MQSGFNLMILRKPSLLSLKARYQQIKKSGSSMRRFHRLEPFTRKSLLREKTFMTFLVLT